MNLGLLSAYRMHHISMSVTKPIGSTWLPKAQRLMEVLSQRPVIVEHTDPLATWSRSACLCSCCCEPAQELGSDPCYGFAELRCILEKLSDSKHQINAYIHEIDSSWWLVDFVSILIVFWIAFLSSWLNQYCQTIPVWLRAAIGEGSGSILNNYKALSISNGPCAGCEPLTSAQRDTPLSCGWTTMPP